MKNYIKIASLLLFSLLIMAPGPQTGGFGFGGNPRPASGQSLAFFEFAPSSGAGMGAACAYPNWQVYSEQFDNAAWIKLGSGVAAPVVTADYGVAPDGTLTADRVQIAACPVGGNRSIVYRGTVFAGITSVYLKGVSGSGQVSLSSTAVTTCNFTSTDWTRCEVTHTGALSNFIIGCDRATTVDTGAADVLVWGAMENAGPTAATYVRTTTASAGFAPTGASGQALTYTRSSSGMCTKTAGGGFSTTGIANGDLVLMPTNQPRISYDGAGYLSILTEAARTNSCFRSQEIENATWLPQNAGSALPIITANQAVAPDGTTTADRVQIAACPSGGNYSLVQSNGTVQTAATASIYVKGVSGAGNLGLAINSTGGPNGFVSCAFVDTSWTRCTVSATGAAATTSIYFGCGNAVVGMSSTGAADVYVWGAQLQSGANITSYIATTSAAVNRTVGIANFSGAGISTTSSMSASVNAGGFAGSQQVMLAQSISGSDWYYLYWGFGGADVNSQSTVGGAQTVSSVTAPLTVFRYYTSNDGTNRTTCRNASCTTGVLATTYTRPPIRFSIGSINGTAPAGSILTSRVCLDPDPARCR